MIKLHAKGTLPAVQSVYFVNPRPKEELYHASKDIHETKNLIDDPAHQEVLKKLRSLLDTWIKETGDYVPELRTADEFDRSTGLPTSARVRPRLSKEEMVKKGLAAP